jgi:hypothetical protein
MAENDWFFLTQCPYLTRSLPAQKNNCSLHSYHLQLGSIFFLAPPKRGQISDCISMNICFTYLRTFVVTKRRIRCQNRQFLVKLF